MKKFYDLIESEAIKKHCAETNYELNTWQCLYLVWNNDRISLEKKHALYEKIMETMPNPQIPETYREYLETNEPVYKLLKEHIKKEKKEAEKFLKSADEPVYQCFYDEKETLKEKIKSHKKYLKEKEDKYEGFEVYNSKIKADAWITYDGNIGKLYDIGTYFDDVINCEELSEYKRIPVPFKYGDIVCYDIFDEKKTCIYVSENEDDYNDSNLYIIEGGTVVRTKIENKQLNFFNGTTGSGDKFITVLSDYLKKKIDVITLLNAYVICFNRAKEEELGHNCIGRDYLKKVIGEEEEDS